MKQEKQSSRGCAPSTVRAETAIKCSTLKGIDLGRRTLIKPTRDPDVDLSQQQLNSPHSSNIDKDLGRSEGEMTDNESFDYSADFEGLVDLVESDGKSAFLIKHQDDFIVRKDAWVGNRRLVPPPKERIPWMLPDAMEVLRHLTEYQMRSSASIDALLYEDLIRYYRQVAELPTEESYHALASWTCHSYLLESANFSPFVVFHGVAERGKSRTGRAMMYVAYRGVRIESLRVAHIIRLTRDLKATIFVDVKDLMQKARQQQGGDCILLRCEKGASVFRVLRPSSKAHEDMDAFPVFGATIFATNEPIDDLHTTRSLAIHMGPATRSFEQDLTPEVGLPLKARLVAFRGAHLGEVLPDCKKPAEGRLGEISRPLMKMVLLAQPQAADMLARFVEGQKAERIWDKSESPDSLLIRAVREAKSEARNGRLLIQTICDFLNRNKDVRSRRDRAWVGRKLSALGFQKVRSGENGSTAILWDEELIEHLSADYGLPSVSSVPSVADRKASTPGATEVLKRRLLNLKHSKNNTTTTKGDLP